MAPPSRPSGPLDFFISYTPADERWAAWIAWELETAGYRTMLQAWDFVAGSNFIDVMDRGVREATIVIAVLSQRYLGSRWGRLEWQTALRAEPDETRSKLVTVRTEDCEIDGLLSMITFIDLVDVTDPAEARDRLLRRVRESLRGRAKPSAEPGYPRAPGAIDAPADPPGTPVAPAAATRRVPVQAPAYPRSVPTRREPRTLVTLLHVAAPRIARVVAPGGRSAGELQARIWGEVTRLTHAGAPQPDLLVISGDLTATAHPREFDAAATFLAGLRALLSLEPHRVVLIPGGHDVNHAASRAYFENCDADDISPEPPFWPKWRHFANLFAEFYQDLDGTVFDSAQPWSLFRMPDLELVVAGLNSTMAYSHRDTDQHGLLGDAQAAWFARQLRPFEDAGWLRLATCHHPPGPALRDTATFQQLLGERLDLLVAGSPSPGGGPADPAGPVVLPAPAPGEVALVVVDAAGVTRWAGASARTERTDRRWRAAATTFPPSAPTSAPTTGQPTAGQPVTGQPTSDQPTGGRPDAGDLGDPFGGPLVAADPATAQLERVADICRARYEGASVRLIPGRVPHLLVTYSEHGYARQLRIGAHLGPVAWADVEAFIQHVHALEPDLGAELVTDVPPAPTLRAAAARRRIRVRTVTEFQGLLDLSDFVADQTARLRDDPRYPPGLYVAARYRELVGRDRGVRAGLAEELLRLVREDDGRFVLLLGDFGRGKTFALREVARRLPAEAPDLVPIFIELRDLDKAHTVDGLVAAHLATHGRDLIDLKAFRYMLREGRIVLLFDGFDELVSRVTYDRAADHLETLLSAAQGDAKIIVASRTHHFRTDADVFTALGERVGLLPARRVLSVEEFEPGQIRDYLINHYGGDTEAADERLALIGDVRDLASLARNPRMLSFIVELDADRLAAAAARRFAVSAAELYREILTEWLDGEAMRTRGVPGSALVLSTADLWTAVTMLAMRLWESGEPYLRLAEISEVAELLTGLTEVRLTPRQSTHAMGAGSLLVRTENGLFGFIHSSVAEWLVAAEIAGRFARGDADPAPLSRRPLSQLSVDFLCDLATAEVCRAWSTAVLGDEPASGGPASGGTVRGEVTRANALKVSARLRAPLHTDLRGMSLRGEDLSYREMRSVDLTGADLTEARLTGASLRGATMRDTRVVAARLDEADLTGADLTGANLTRARLMGATLTDATADGTTQWRQAALVGVTGDPALLADARRAGAAVAPGQAVGIGLAPTAIGVLFGFEVGRIPEPVAFSPDGTILAVANEDGGVLICDAGTARPLRTLQGHSGRAYVVRCAPDVLVSGSADTTVRVWDPVNGVCRHTLGGHDGWVWPVELDAAGTLLAVGDRSGTVRLWDVAAGEVRALLPGHTTRVWTAAFSPAGTGLLATGDDGGAVRLWDTATGEQRREIPGTRPVYRLLFSPDGTVLVTAGDGGMVRLWDTVTGELLADLDGHLNAVYTVDFHPGGQWLATGDIDGVVRVRPVPGKGAGAGAGAGAGRTVTRHAGSVYRVRFSPDGALLATGDSGSVLRLIDPVSGELRKQLTGHRGSVWPMAFRPDGETVVTSSNDGTARVWDTSTGACVATLAGLGRRLGTVRFSPDGSLLATSGGDGEARLWDPRTGVYLGPLTGVADRLLSVVFTPVGGRIAASGSAGSVHLWNLAGTGGTGYERELRVETDYVWAKAFSPDGDILATANDDDSVQLWYRSTGRNARAFPDHRGRVRSVAFSPDGTRLATGCDDTVVRVWDVETGACPLILTGHTDRVYAVLFTPDGRWLVSASNDGTARLWDAATGALARTFADHAGKLWSAALSPDGTLLATAGDDLVVRLTELTTGRVVAALAGHTRRVLSLDFSPPGTRLASCGDDGTVRLWDVSRPERAAPAVTLVAHDTGWAALAPDGGYKIGGDLAGDIWHVIGMCRFELGDLDAYLDAVRPLPADATF
jgi:WD40 repeat protein